MAIDNLISIVLTDEEVEIIEKAIDAIDNVLKDKAVNLTPEERKQFGSIADKNKVLVDKCKYYMEANPETLPKVIDKDEFDRDYKAREQMEKPYKRLARIMEKLQDTKTLLDHDNFHAAIAYYRYIKFLASQNEAGTSTIHNDLKKQYHRINKNKNINDDDF